MRNPKNWLLVAAVIWACGGTVAIIDTVFSRSVSADERDVGDHWRNHNGHWSYWHAADKRWYYTDGSHWYANHGNDWRIYNFDAHFGRKNFEHGTYRVPGPEVKVVVPRHETYRFR